MSIIQALNEQFKKVKEELAENAAELSDYDTGFEEGYLAGLMSAIEFVKEMTEGEV